MHYIVIWRVRVSAGKEEKEMATKEQNLGWMVCAEYMLQITQSTDEEHPTTTPISRRIYKLIIVTIICDYSKDEVCFTGSNICSMLNRTEWVIKRLRMKGKNDIYCMYIYITSNTTQLIIITTATTTETATQITATTKNRINRIWSHKFTTNKEHRTTAKCEEDYTTKTWIEKQSNATRRFHRFVW